MKMVMRIINGKFAGIGFIPKQYEFECSCGHIWIDSENNGCPMCGNTLDMSVMPYETKHPDTFGKRHE